MVLHFKSKWSKIPQIVCNMHFRHLSTRYDSFYFSGVFYFVTRSFVNRPKFYTQKAVFSENSVIIDFLENELIFNLAKYAVTCFTLRST